MVKNYFLSLVVFLGIDSMWLGFIAKDFYNKHLGVFNRAFDLKAAILVYLLIPLGIVFFVLPQAGNNTRSALLFGALYGLISYGVYDLTNMATLKDWSWTMVVVDTLWGVFICSLTSFLIVHFFVK